MKPAVFRPIIPLLATIWLAGGVVVLSGSGSSGEEAGTRLNEVVFIDFFAAFLTVLLVSPRGKKRPWKEWSRGEKCLSIAGAALIIATGGWLLHGLGGWLVALPWMTALGASWHDTATLSRRALGRVGWALASAFLVALAGSFTGADLDTWLSSDPRGTLAWCLLYFCGNVSLEGIWLRQGRN